MACASFDDTLTTVFEELEINYVRRTVGLCDQKDKPQLCVEGYYFRVNHETKGNVSSNDVKFCNVSKGQLI